MVLDTLCYIFYDLVYALVLANMYMTFKLYQYTTKWTRKLINLVSIKSFSLIEILILNC